jgi:hypothetical protein
MKKIDEIQILRLININLICDLKKGYYLCGIKFEDRK